MIVIINYGMGNLGSIKNMFDKIRVPAMISSEPADIAKADKLILPGVGSYDNGMTKLDEFGLLPILNRKVLEEKTPVLGVCLGMQLMGNSSEEGSKTGLRWIDAEVKKFSFPANSGLRVPHMGWNRVDVKENPLCLFDKIEHNPKFYFVHSYHFQLNDPSALIGETTYEYRFPSAVRSGNIYGVQFHPEKSHKYGMQLYINFAAL